MRSTGRPLLRRLLIAIAIPAISCVIIALVASRSAPHQTLPNPNGYDDFVRAGETIAGNVSDFANLDPEAIRELVATNAESLRLLRVALTRPAAVPTDALIRNFATASSDFIALKNLVCCNSTGFTMVDLL